MENEDNIFYTPTSSKKSGLSRHENSSFLSSENIIEIKKSEK
jgi:hypothetical protein